MIGVLPGVDPTAALLGLGMDGLEHVGGLEGSAQEGEYAQPVEGEGFLEAFVQAGLSVLLCNWPLHQTGTRPGNTRARWFSAAGQSCTGRVHR